ncbi:MAG TPA: membrane protein insertase YidC [Gemmatirosa sp.]|nr:membrane protein insertase YidC [Gemmatirosa sp.]
MDNNRRFFLAFLLTALVLVAANYFFPSAPPPPAPVARSTPAAPSVVPTPAAGAPGAVATVGAAPAPAAAVATLAVPAAPVETVTVGTGRAAYRVSSLGGALVGARMQGYRSLRPNVPNGTAVELARPGEALLSYRLVVPGDTLALSQVPFRVTRNGTSVRLDGTASGRVAQNVPVSLTYAVQSDSFVVRVQGSVQGVTGPSFLLVDLPPTLAVTERDSLDHYTQLSFAWKPRSEGASGVAFAKLDPGEREFAEGPLTWAVTKSKYFLVGVLANPQQPFAEAAFTGGARTSKVATRAQGTVVLPLANGGFAFESYVGPQEWKRLVAMGRDFENANPYGGWLQGLVQPFATIAIRFILWMHDNVKLSYGLVLVALGVLVRLVMWPLQQNMLRNQIKMQRIQPELQIVQEKYKGDPQRFQQEMMKVYQSHGMSPFSPLTGCLPMLLPMPIFFALFFVFQNTIEFRGVPFLWLADISLKDPFYILPIAVAATQFLMSWIGMRGTPPNPQTQMITYMMPAMFLIFFLNVAAGLNLYYFVQNLVGLPQQWLLARERTKAGGTPVVQGTAVKPTAKPSRA